MFGMQLLDCHGRRDRYIIYQRYTVPSVVVVPVEARSIGQQDVEPCSRKVPISMVGYGK